MLKPAQIKNHHFEASGRNAYRADSVDRFFEEVADNYDQMFRENGEMYKKIGLLAEKLEEYKNDEDNIRNALLTAQRMSEQIQREAREKSDAMLADAQARAIAENARVDAEVNEMMAKATYQAQALIEEAKKQAEKIIYDATHESKEAAISARDWMIKEEAALEMMKIEVTKFKKQILDSYAQQLELIERIPEIVYAQIDAEIAAAEAAEVVEEVEEAAEVEEEIYEETVALPSYEEIEEDEMVATVALDSEDMDIATLQQMIKETEDTDAEDEPYEETVADVSFESDDDSDDFIIPVVEEDANTNLDEIVGYFSDSNAPSVANAYEEAPAESGFSFDVDKISAYDEVQVVEEDFDELDEEFDDDDDNGEDLASKFKSFFKK